MLKKMNVNYQTFQNMFSNFLIHQYVYTYIYILYAMTSDTRPCDLFILKYAICIEYV